MSPNHPIKEQTGLPKQSANTSRYEEDPSFRQKLKEMTFLEWIGVFFGFLTLIVLAYATYAIFWNADLYGSQDLILQKPAKSLLDLLAQIGDFLSGAAGTLGSLAALIYLIHSVNMQKKDLAEQRKDITITQELQQHEQFSDMFFNYLGFLRDVVNHMEYKSGNQHGRGQACFRIYCQKLLSAFKNSEVKNVFRTENSSHKLTAASKKNVRNLFRTYEDLDYFFRNLYGLLSLVYQARNLSANRRQEYLSMAEKQLTGYTQFLLAMYALSAYEGNGIRDYISSHFYEKVKSAFNDYYRGKVKNFTLPPDLSIFERNLKISDHDAS